MRLEMLNPAPPLPNQVDRYSLSPVAWGILEWRGVGG